MSKGQACTFQFSHCEDLEDATRQAFRLARQMIAAEVTASVSVTRQADLAAEITALYRLEENAVAAVRDQRPADVPRVSADETEENARHVDTDRSSGR